jgi:IMP dehydrogenase
MREMFTFDDVLIVPKFSDVQSRKEVDLSTKIGKEFMTLPIISANMDTVTNVRMAQSMIENGAQACLHRFGTIQENANDFLVTAGYLPGKCAMVSVGLGVSELQRAKELHKYGARTFVIDVAHGAQLAVAQHVKMLREIIGPRNAIVVGNFATADSVKAFLDQDIALEVDAIKVGIGPGSACTTRIKTGVGFPQLSAIVEIAKLLKSTPIKVIADGGMKTSGDIAKALGAGAHAVMLGGMLAGTDETPGEVLYVHDVGSGTLSKDSHDSGVAMGYLNNDWTGVKKYRGSASKESYTDQGKNTDYRTAEGESFMVPYKGPVKNILQDIEGGLRSALTYVGARNIKEFHEKVEFIRISSATAKENSAHGANK